MFLTLPQSYGRDIQIYSTIQCMPSKFFRFSIYLTFTKALIRNGVDPLSINVVIPPYKQPCGCFDNDIIEQKVCFFVKWQIIFLMCLIFFLYYDLKVQNHLTGLGVKVYSGYKINDWEVSESDQLKAITIFVRTLYLV